MTTEFTSHSIDFSVAIRTYNGSDRLPFVLDALLQQVETEAIAWEVVIVDNNSSDDTSEVVRQYQQQWRSDCPLRYVFEPQQGAAIARRSAIEAARGELIGFLDDDNVPLSNWVAAAIAFAKDHPRVGAFGSKILPEYEVEPEDSFGRIAYFLPTMEIEEPFCYQEQPQRGYPVGAGLVVKRDVWLHHVGANQLIQGPVGQGFALKGEEIEALSYIRKTAWELWYNPEMTIIHRIPKWRLERAYLLNFFRVIGLSQHRFRMLRLDGWQRPLYFPMFVVNDVKRIVQHYAKYRHVLATDIAAACEWQLALYRLVSPLYIWKNLLVRRRIKPDFRKG